jgi:hypothetical protein
VSANNLSGAQNRQRGRVVVTARFGRAVAKISSPRRRLALVRVFVPNVPLEASVSLALDRAT